MKNKKLFFALLIVLGLLLGACAPTTLVTVNGGTPKPVGGQQLVADQFSTPPKGDPTCVGPDATDQGWLYLCYPEVTQEVVLAVPGLSQAVSSGTIDQLGRILIYTLLNGTLTLDPPVVDAQPIAWLVPYPQGVKTAEDQWAQAQINLRSDDSYAVPDAGTITGMSTIEADTYKRITQNPYWVLDSVSRYYRMYVAFGDPSGIVWVVFRGGIQDDATGSSGPGIGGFIQVFYGSLDAVRVRFCLHHVVMPNSYTPRIDFQYDPVSFGGRGLCEALGEGEDNKLPQLK